MTAVQPIRTALIGFGLSGRDFHAPFIQADPAYSLDFIVTGSPERAARARAACPGTAVLATVDELFGQAHRLDLVLVCTPPASHVELAGRAIEHGLNVVVDKPFAPTSAEAEELILQARQANVLLSVYQNRRWDSDFLTLRQLIDAGELGRIHRFESRFERWSPHGLRTWKGTSGIADGGGILFDLGSHLIDQALQLFGPVSTVYGETARHLGAEDSDADDDAFVSLLHESGVRSHLSMNLVSGLSAPRFHVLGSGAAYTKWGLDGQEAALAAGLLPTDPGYGVEPKEHWGTLGVPGDTRKVPAERGAYPEFYRLLAEALAGDGPVPVDPADSVAVLRIIEEVHWQAGG
ncbi:Gfo/Idh/MocA family protein [Arthrobacter mobilis]|uniref:Gfo/Idh/MocA family oxidoreductase n=1 Tax=Arthrobacter mobilis TaxID=2724944 RepID=A0A7X6K5W0_9MICC|nr:Gfo/Idh/MocA family oxidoreductase [Arthrobacter mobilis]NKX54789.1 Gfo/Idh/MocA family oxidoreductase [Arthrobacter mobilis]